MNQYQLPQMMRRIFVTLIGVTALATASHAAPLGIGISENLTKGADGLTARRILYSLDRLLDPSKPKEEQAGLIANVAASETKFLLELVENTGEHKKELVNLFQVGADSFALKIAVTEKLQDGELALSTVFSLVATIADGDVVFSSPLKYRTRNWSRETIGNTVYVFQGSIDVQIAAAFDSKNKAIANKFRLPTKQLMFYKCANYEEVLLILGVDFDANSAGIVQSSEAYGDTIVTGLDTENFSHDLFHMYMAEKFPDNDDRNFIAEEGYANSIADAYYAKSSGQIITRDELVHFLKELLDRNLNTDLMRLFRENPRVYYNLSNEVSSEVFQSLSVRSTIASLICDQVEKEKGMDGLISLLRSGKGEDAFFRATGDLIGITKENFNPKVRDLIVNY